MIKLIGKLIGFIILPLLVIIQVIQNLFSKKYKQPLYHFKSQYFHKRIGHYDTEYLKVQKKHDGKTDEKSEKDITIVLIPGNPGYVRFYDLFLNQLAANLNYAYNIYAVCHVGHLGHGAKKRKFHVENEYKSHKHSHNDHKHSHSPHRNVNNQNKSKARNMLEEQIEHKVEFMQYLMHKHPNTKFIFISHSIGSYIILNTLDYLPRDKILHSFKLFPTIEKMNESPNHFNANLFTKFPFSFIGSTFAHALQYLPDFLKRIIIQLVLQDQNQQEPIEDIVETVTSFLDYTTVSSICTLAQFEFATVKKRPDSLIKKYIDSITLYYGLTDGWVPLSFYKQIKEDIPNIDARLDEKGLEHAFVVGGSRTQAELLANWINQIISQKCLTN